MGGKRSNVAVSKPTKGKVSKAAHQHAATNDEIVVAPRKIGRGRKGSRVSQKTIASSIAGGALVAATSPGNEKMEGERQVQQHQGGTADMIFQTMLPTRKPNRYEGEAHAEKDDYTEAREQRGGKKHDQDEVATSLSRSERSNISTNDKRKRRVEDSVDEDFSGDGEEEDDRSESDEDDDDDEEEGIGQSRNVASSAAKKPPPRPPSEGHSHVDGHRLEGSPHSRIISRIDDDDLQQQWMAQQVRQATLEIIWKQGKFITSDRAKMQAMRAVASALSYDTKTEKAIDMFSRLYGKIVMHSMNNKRSQCSQAVEKMVYGRCFFGVLLLVLGPFLVVSPAY